MGVRFFVSIYMIPSIYVYMIPYLYSVPISYAMSHVQKLVSIYICYCRKLRNMIRKSRKLTIAICNATDRKKDTHTKKRNTSKVIEREGLNGEQCTDELAKWKSSECKSCQACLDTSVWQYANLVQSKMHVFPNYWNTFHDTLTIA